MAQRDRDIQIDDVPVATNAQGKKSDLGVGVVLIVFAMALIVALWVGAGIVGHQAHEQGAHTLRQSIIDAAMQCFAIEGSYPVDLDYLEENYGLSINTEEYSVIYEAFASNVLPSVVVKAK